MGYFYHQDGVSLFYLPISKELVQVQGLIPLQHFLSKTIFRIKLLAQDF